MEIVIDILLATWMYLPILILLRVNYLIEKESNEDISGLSWMFLISWCVTYALFMSSLLIDYGKVIDGWDKPITLGSSILAMSALWNHMLMAAFIFLRGYFRLDVKTLKVWI